MQIYSFGFLSRSNHECSRLSGWLRIVWRHSDLLPEQDIWELHSGAEEAEGAVEEGFALFGGEVAPGS